MSELTTDEILTSVAVVILLFTAMVNWNIYSWLLLLAIVMVLAAWYFRKSRGPLRPHCSEFWVTTKIN